jgi:DNA-3-methyladenine glycosylase II
MAPTTRARLPKPVAEAAAKIIAQPKKRVSPGTDASASDAKTDPLVDSRAAVQEAAATKRRKVSPKKSQPVPPPRPPLDLSKAVYQPSMVPVEPKFSVQEAMNHLIRFDPRFKGLFEAMKCRPFVEPFEALDPYRTLTTSIVGQQVSTVEPGFGAMLINQVSWMAARAINNRFRGLFGYKEDDEEGFPSPADVVKKDVLVLKSAGLSMRKAEYGELKCAKEEVV